jgi:multicomponent Na+:H+ antiporter subunit F
MIIVAVVAAVFLAAAAGMALARIVRGPSTLDRVVATDVLLAITVCAIATEAAYSRDATGLPILLGLSLLGAVGSVAVARFADPAAQPGPGPASNPGHEPGSAESAGPYGVTESAGHTRPYGVTESAGHTRPYGVTESAGDTDPRRETASAGHTDPHGETEPVRRTAPSGDTESAGTTLGRLL